MSRGRTGGERAALKAAGLVAAALGTAALVAAAAAASITGCIPDDVTHARGARALREGRAGTMHGAVTSAGTVRVLDGALDQGIRACSGGSGGPRVCVHGGLTAQGRRGQ